MASKHASARQRQIQVQVAKADKQRPKKERKGPMQAGAREYPAPPFPKQYQGKPGSEGKLNLLPLYDAPFYVGSAKLGKKGRADYRRRFWYRAVCGHSFRSRRSRHRNRLSQ